ncbi:MAG: response regulator, partial [Sideroxyarcus sp.]|nr:response regulator [Sideroxyarcus sp.]
TFTASIYRLTMFDILVSFGLGILLGVCLTLLTLSIKNKRKAQESTEISETAETNTISASTLLGQDIEQDAIRQRMQENLAHKAVKSEFDELEGFVRLEGAATESPAPEIANEIPSGEHLESEWIEAERVEATRIELELHETARLETIQQASDHFVEDHPDSEEIRNLNLQEEFAALQALQALQMEVSRAEAERIEEDRNEAERIEAIRLAAERIETERIETERIDAERVEAARIEAERIDAERAQALRDEAERTEAAHIEAARVEAARVEAERVEAERIEAERIETERIDAERAHALRIEAERAEAARVEAERIDAELAEAERVEAELLEQEYATLQAAQLAAELAAKEAATLEIEHASRRAADAAALREAERAKAAAEHVEAERVKAEAQGQLDQFAEAKAVSTEISAEAVNANIVGIVEKVRKAPEDTLIMIADDSKVVRVKTSRVLIKHQYQVTLAEDGNEAASQLDFIMPDLLITDVEMPGMDGFELTQHLRSNPATAKLPIIMISGGSDELVDKAKLAGIDVLLGKPYSDEDLISHIRRLTHGT